MSFPWETSDFVAVSPERIPPMRALPYFRFPSQASHSTRLSRKVAYAKISCRHNDEQDDELKVEHKIQTRRVGIPRLYLAAAAIAADTAVAMTLRSKKPVGFCRPVIHLRGMDRKVPIRLGRPSYWVVPSMGTDAPPLCEIRMCCS